MKTDYGVKAFCQQTTFHGLREITETNHKLMKFLHLSLVVLMNALSIYNCYHTLATYWERPVATSYFVKESPALQLPDVTICPFNRLNRQFLEKNKIPWDLANYIEHAFFMVNPHYEYMPIETSMFVRLQNADYARSMIRQLDEKLTELNNTFEQFLEDASMKCEDIVGKCIHRLSAVPCCNQSQKIWSSFGKCFRITGVMQQSAGYDSGVSILLSFPREKFTLAENNLHNEGMLLKLTEPGKGFEFDAIFIPPGRHALLQLSATKLEFMNDKPRYSCIDHAPAEYAPLRCYEDCVLRPTVEHCKCRHIGSPLLDPHQHNYSVCKPHELLGCFYGRMADTVGGLIPPCKAKCRSRCAFWQYTPTVSYSLYPSIQAKHFLRAPGAFEAHMEDTVLELFYDRLEYTLIKHFPSMTSDNFISNIGGQVGLWMGGSVLSVIHLIAYFAFGVFNKGHEGAQTAHKNIKQTVEKRKHKKIARSKWFSLMHETQSTRKNSSEMAVRAVNRWKRHGDYNQNDSQVE